jgi:hypothetical protein
MVSTVKKRFGWIDADSFIFGAGAEKKFNQ